MPGHVPGAVPRHVLGTVPIHVPGAVPIMFRGLCQLCSGGCARLYVLYCKGLTVTLSLTGRSAGLPVSRSAGQPEPLMEMASATYKFSNPVTLV